jgi:hypothetical protein
MFIQVENCKICRKNVLDTKCVFCFSLRCLIETFSIMNIDTIRQCFVKCYNTEFHENLSLGSRVNTWTDRYDQLYMRSFPEHHAKNT